MMVTKMTVWSESKIHEGSPNGTMETEKEEMGFMSALKSQEVTDNESEDREGCDEAICTHLHLTSSFVFKKIPNNGTISMSRQYSFTRRTTDTNTSVT